MATTGSLREIPLAALIETGCRSRAAARLRLRHGDLEGELYFSDGELVHAVCGELKGEPALWRLLRWTDGQFTLEDEVRSPERTLYRPWQDLLLEGMQRAAAPEPTGPRSLHPGELVSRLKAIEGVMGVVVAGPDGVVLAADVPEGKGEAEGALTVYLAAAAETLARFLPMGAFEHAVVSEPQRRLLIFRHPPLIVGLALSPQASPALVLAELPRPALVSPEGRLLVWGKGGRGMGVEEALQEVNAIPGVEGGILFTEEGTILAHTLPERYTPEALVSAVRIAARTMEALETSRRRVQEVDLVFTGGRLILRRLPGGFLALCCARSVNLPLLNLALGPVVRSLTAALKERPERPAAPRRPRPVVPRVSPVIQDLVQEGRRLVEAARAQGITLRLLGSIGIAYHCPSALRYLPVPAFIGLELAGASRERRAVEAFLQDQGYEPFTRFNAFYGARRLHFRKPETGWPVDIFLDAYEMYHRLEFASVLTREEVTLPPAYLLLSRLQAVEAGEADLLEIAVLLLDHEVVEGEQAEAVDLRAIVALCADDWGWYRTVTMNIERAARVIAGWEAAERERVQRRLERLRQAIEAAPKSLGWQMRARLGEAVRWYQTPLRVEEGPRPDLAIG